ncbi:hypothetical protein LWI28_011250 [Acer negundo]|uniref:F-box domain-containing protein n=1 Tax=Acer negundo TaxID=4023 RepID=A0AAD5JF66_ACENE|nr:hypothetical protein LWI28_011250 [Acer negundo]KAK4858358.1 hypothetical protein QYF36_015241 [Acer negundo]
MSGKTADLEWPNWVGLPPDVTAVIFSKLGGIEVMTSVQYVCSSWLKMCKDPYMWRTIDMHNLDDEYGMDFDLDMICRAAVDRSNGHLSSINIEYFGTDELLHYIADRSSHLTSLRLVYCYDISDQGLIDSIVKFPLLEELELSYCSLSRKSLEAVGRSCPLLKSFKLNREGQRDPMILCNEEALAIAENMHELRHLQIFGNKLMITGLEALLNGCPHLKSLDMRQCFNIYLEGNLKKRCLEQIQHLHCPNDSTSDYEFDATVRDAYDFGSDDYGNYDDPFGMLDIGVMSDDDYDNELSDHHFDHHFDYHFDHHFDYGYGYDYDYDYNPDDDF